MFAGASNRQTIGQSSRHLRDVPHRRSQNEQQSLTNERNSSTPHGEERPSLQLSDVLGGGGVVIEEHLNSVQRSVPNPQLARGERVEYLESSGYSPPYTLREYPAERYHRYLEDSGGAPLPISESWASSTISSRSESMISRGSTALITLPSTLRSSSNRRHISQLPTDWIMNANATQNMSVRPHFYRGGHTTSYVNTEDRLLELAPTHNSHTLVGNIVGGEPVGSERDHHFAARQQGIAPVTSNYGPSTHSIQGNFGSDAQSSCAAANNGTNNSPSSAPSLEPYSTPHSNLSSSIDSDCGGAAITPTIGTRATYIGKGRHTNSDHNIDEDIGTDTEDDESDGGIEFEIGMESAGGQVEVMYPPSSPTPTLMDEDEEFSTDLITRPSSPVTYMGIVDQFLASQHLGFARGGDRDVDMSDSNIDSSSHLPPASPLSFALGSPQSLETRQIPDDVLAFAQSINAPTEPMGLPGPMEDEEVNMYEFNGVDIEDGNMTSDVWSELATSEARPSLNPPATDITLEGREDSYSGGDEGADTEIPAVDTFSVHFPATFGFVPQTISAIPGYTYSSNIPLMLDTLIPFSNEPTGSPGLNNDVFFGHDLPYQDSEKYNADFEGFFGWLWNHQMSSPRRIPTRHQYPTVSVEARRISEWAKDRPLEITHEDAQGERGDMQGIQWENLGITKQQARLIRRATYLNYRNVKDFTKENLPQIESNRKFFSFRRLDTAQACRLMHFQLRNVMCMTSRNDIFYSTGISVVAHHPITSSTRNLMDLSEASGQSNPIRISTLGACGGRDAVLIAGGFHGNYALKALNANIENQMEVGVITDHENGITNHIQVIKRRTSGNPTAVFCSNDSYIRVMDCMDNRQFLAIHPFDWAVNCSATSPDCRLRAVVGDSKDVLIVDADRGLTEFTLVGHQDFGFAVAWSDDGYTIATGNQDQTMRIFDARNLSKTLKVFPTLMAGCRTLRFSPLGNGGRPVLAMAEPADYIHVIDAITWEDAQTVQFWGEIGGMEFSPNGDELVVANCDKSVGGLMTFERSRVTGWYDMHHDYAPPNPLPEWNRVSQGEDLSYSGKPWKRLGASLQSVYV